MRPVRHRSVVAGPAGSRPGCALMSRCPRPTAPLFSVVIPTFDRGDLLPAGGGVGAGPDRSTTSRSSWSTTPGPSRSSCRPTLGSGYVRRTTNGGAGACRNTGVDVATGRYLAFLDDDDVWVPHRLELALAGPRPRPDRHLLEPLRRRAAGDQARPRRRCRRRDPRRRHAAPRRHRARPVGLRAPRRALPGERGRRVVAAPGGGRTGRDGGPDGRGDPPLERRAAASDVLAAPPRRRPARPRRHRRLVPRPPARRGDALAADRPRRRSQVGDVAAARRALRALVPRSDRGSGRSSTSPAPLHARSVAGRCRRPRRPATRSPRAAGDHRHRPARRPDLRDRSRRGARRPRAPWSRRWPSGAGYDRRRALDVADPRDPAGSSRDTLRALRREAVDARHRRRPRVDARCRRAPSRSPGRGCPFVYRQISDSLVLGARSAPPGARAGVPRRGRLRWSRCRRTRPTSCTPTSGSQRDRLHVVPNGVPAAAFPVVDDARPGRGPARRSPSRPTRRSCCRSRRSCPRRASTSSSMRSPASRPDRCTCSWRATVRRRAELERQASDLGSRVVVHRRPRSTPASAYAAADVMVLASRGGDSMPATLVEAAFCGVPVVTTPVGAITEVVIDGDTGHRRPGRRRRRARRAHSGRLLGDPVEAHALASGPACGPCSRSRSVRSPSSGTAS